MDSLRSVTSHMCNALIRMSVRKPELQARVTEMLLWLERACLQLVLTQTKYKEGRLGVVQGGEAGGGGFGS